MYQERRNTIAKWKNLASINIKATEDIRTKANNLHTYGLKPKDALHVAAALAAQCDYFLTTDKQLLKKNEYIKGIQILNPIEFICLQEEPNEI